MIPWGIDLEGRKMRYESWPLSPAGGYRAPSEAEREKTFGIKGEALAETLAYFESQGGDSSRLVSMLNEHALDERFTIDRDGLMDAERWYNSEYYFYFIMFGKKVIGRYDFHFGEGKDRQLSEYHRIIEKGRMDFVPFGLDSDGAIIQDIATITNAAVLSYLDNEMKVNTGEFYSWMGLSFPVGYEFDEGLFESETSWVSSELIHFGYCYIMILANSNRILSEGTAFSVRKRMRIGRLLVTVPFRLASSAIKTATQKTTRTYEYDISVSRARLHVEARPVPSYLTRKIGIYRASVLRHSLETAIGSFEAVCCLLFNLKQSPIYKATIGDDSLDYAIDFMVPATKPRVMEFVYSAIILLGLTIAFFGSKYLAVFVIIVCGAMTIREARKRIDLEAKLTSNLDASREQYSALEESSKQLLTEKNLLSERVLERTSELAAANERLQELDRAKTDFFYNVSHELRTPITMIRSPIEAIMAGERGQKVSKDDPYFKIIIRNSDRLLRQVNNLLDFAKIEQGRAESKPRAIDLGELCGLYCAELESLALTRGICLKFVRPEGPCVIEIDPELFEKAFFNLAANALKFTLPGGRVTVVVERGEGRIDIVVSDSGIGIPAEKLGFIFERFAQVDSGSARHYEGTGLGLPLVKEIASLIGAKLGVRSELGVGSEFRLSFLDPGDIERDGSWDDVNRKTPAYLLADVQPGADAPSLDQGARQSAPEGSLLLVEDNADLVSFLAPLLEKKYRLKVAFDGAAALEAIRADTQGIDLVLSDIMMPIMDGRELHRACRLEGIGIPFLFLTARASDAEKVEALREGAIDYISKPFAMDELMSKIAVMVGLSSRLKAEATRGLESRVLKAIRNAPEGPPRSSIDELGLSARGLDVARILLSGDTDKGIACKLGIATKTASSHVAAVLAKAGVQSRTEFMAKFHKD
jgi:signal transduction histidine kinase/DNA-binding NarL/FixJ family response regulator